MVSGELDLAGRYVHAHAAAIAVPRVRTGRLVDPA
jgi:hypothetical protein